MNKNNVFQILSSLAVSVASVAVLGGQASKDAIYKDLISSTRSGQCAGRHEGYGPGHIFSAIRVTYGLTPTQAAYTADEIQAKRVDLQGFKNAYATTCDFDLSIEAAASADRAALFLKIIKFSADQDHCPFFGEPLPGDLPEPGRVLKEDALAAAEGALADSQNGLVRLGRIEEKFRRDCDADAFGKAADSLNSPGVSTSRTASSGTGARAN